jgi:hypothetical protein
MVLVREGRRLRVDLGVIRSQHWHQKDVGTCHLLPIQLLMEE